jgi:hypothetical protein
MALRRRLALVGVLLLLAPALPARAGADAADADAWIGRMNEALLPGRSMTAKAVLTTTDPSGAFDRVAFDFARLTDPQGVHRTLIEVTAPESGKGVVYQVIARPGHPLESWVWLPAVGRLRRIVGIHRTDHFLGSEFTYEDVGLAAPSERRRGEVREVTEDGRRWIVLESPPYHYYGRVQTYLDPATGMPQRVVYYDRAGQPFRKQRFEAIREIGGHRFPTEIEIEDNLTGTTSRLVFSHVEFDVEIPVSRYDESIVGRKLRGGWPPDVPAPVE